MKQKPVTTKQPQI